ncbi:MULTISPECIES: hypothetical protein [Actinoplanes]|uniref:hypothetical protein n=1 Tax=Actinoplanes TaxID=1865 RepID=UPI0006964F33|nr:MULTISPECIES: hypothetical protein [Actinoplanes]GLY01006.1 hypothetical protein Acsp01_13850 [Actinoplanes sp. NBRC 101535]
MTTSEVETEPAAAPRVPWSGWERVIRAGGVVVSILATLVTALVEIELSAFRVGSVAALLDGDSPWTGGGALIPIATPVAVGLNLAIAWFAETTTGRRWAVGVPWALWTLLMLAAAGTRKAEGDLLFQGDNWTVLLTITAGSLTFAVYAYKMILKPPTAS